MEPVEQVVAPSEMRVAPIGNVPDAGPLCSPFRWYVTSRHRLLGDVFLNKMQQIHSRSASGVVAIPISLGAIAIVAHPFHHQSMHRRKVTQGSIERGGFHIDPNGLAIVLPCPL